MLRTGRTKRPTDFNKNRSSCTIRANVSTISQSELMEDLVARENDFLLSVKEFAEEAEQLKEDQMAFDTMKEGLEDRSLGILSFATSINLFKRFLDSREANARRLLGHPIDDLDDLERVVEQLEASLKLLQCDITDTVNEEIEHSNIEDDLAAETLESQNAARRMELMIKRAVQAKPALVSDVQPITFARHAQAQAPSNAAFEAADQEIAEIEKLEKLTDEKQASLDKLYADIDAREVAVGSLVAEMEMKYRAKQELIEKLRRKLDDVDDLKMQVHLASSRNGDLRLKVSEEADKVGEARRIVAIGTKKQELYDSDQQQNEVLLAKYQERAKFARKRAHQFKKRKEDYREFAAEVKNLEEYCDEYIESIMNIESESHNVELELNAALKEAQRLVEEVREESFESSGFDVSKTGEIQKLLSLVIENESEE